MPLSSHAQEPHNVAANPILTPEACRNKQKMTLTQSFGTTTSSNTLSQPSKPSQPSQLPQPQLPRADLFDILPPLHELLARIDHIPAESGPVDEGDNALGAAYADLQPLEPKDLPGEALAIKAKIRRALRELEGLPDMERSVEEQQEEIEELDERIRRQQEVLKQLGAAAVGVKGRLG